MNNSTIVFLINDDVRAIKVQYEPDGPTTLFKTFDPAIKVDDFVVVQSGTRHMITTGKVVAVDADFDIDTSIKMDWIVGRIDMYAHEDTIRQENAAIAAVQSAEKKRKRDELRKTVLAGADDAIKALTLANHSDDGSGPVSE